MIFDHLDLTNIYLLHIWYGFGIFGVYSVFNQTLCIEYTLFEYEYCIYLYKNIWYLYSVRIQVTNIFIFIIIQEFDIPDTLEQIDSNDTWHTDTKRRYWLNIENLSNSALQGKVDTGIACRKDNLD